MIGQIRFTNATVPDGTTDRVMALKMLSGRALVLPVEIPHEDDYSFSVWVKSDTIGSLTINVFGNSEQVNTTGIWQRVTVIADTRQGNIVTVTPGTNDEYFLYQAMLETGNKPSGWSPSPDDEEQKIREIKQSMLELTPEAIIGTVMNSREMTELRQESDRVAILVDTFTEDGVTRVHNSAVIIDQSGILMNGGVIDIQAGSVFRVQSNGVFQVNAASPTDNFMNLGDKFIVSDDGSMKCSDAIVDKMSVNGYEPWTRENIVVSSEKPEKTPCIWLQPNGTTALTLDGTMNTTTAYLSQGPQSMTVRKVTSGTMPDGQTYTYTLTTSIGNTTQVNVRNIRLQAQISDGTHTVTGFLAETFSLGAVSSKIVTMSVYGSPINVCGTGNPVTVTYSLVSSVGQLNIRVNPDYRNTLVAETRIQSGMTPCALYWCP